MALKFTAVLLVAMTVECRVQLGPKQPKRENEPQVQSVEQTPETYVPPTRKPVPKEYPHAIPGQIQQEWERDNIQRIFGAS